MGRRGIETLVGGFVLLGIVGLAFLSLQAANLTTYFGQGDTYVLQARFDNIGGLKTRAPVRSAGVNVGRVTSITLDPATFEGVVTLTVDARVRFPRDSIAKILTAGLLGDQYIGIDPGADEAVLQPGDRVAQTQGAVVLEDLIGRFLFDRAADGSTPAAPGGQP